jgi:peptidoglycan-N-acetylglucosamine deacetylase
MIIYSINQTHPIYCFMFKFRTISYIFLITVACMIVTKFLYEYSPIWFIILLIIYTIILFLGSKNICSQMYTDVLCVSDDRSKVHLTFDDGPHPEITEKVLEILMKYNQKAIFFCTGKNIENNPQIIQHIISQGHEIGNHTYSHSVAYTFARTSKVILELQKTNRLIEDYTGKTCKLFRPPFGVTNPNIAKAVKKIGMNSIGWSIRSMDTINDKDSVLKRLRMAKPGDIVLLHDTKIQTPEILEEFLRFN